MTDSELIVIEQALRLASHVVPKQNALTLGKLSQALAVVQAIPHVAECLEYPCEYCMEREEKQAEEGYNVSFGCWDYWSDCPAFKLTDIPLCPIV